MEKGSVKQILLITDGCSNQGEDPVLAAAFAKEQGITVNVIGVIENEAMDEQGLAEIEGIAEQGGGISQVVYTKALSQTVKMVTQKAMTQTLQGVVNKELSQILGSEAQISDLPPDKRGEVMEVVDELNETIDLQIVVLVDTSASMKYKLQTVKEALFDLSLSLGARTGKNMFSVAVFPGKRKPADQILEWTPQIDSLSSVTSKLSSGGITPTGPAIKEAIGYFKRKRSLRGLLTTNDEGYFEESV